MKDHWQGYVKDGDTPQSYESMKAELEATIQVCEEALSRETMLLGMLRKMEWRHRDESHFAGSHEYRIKCDICNQQKHMGHDSNCELGNLLAVDESPSWFD